MTDFESEVKDLPFLGLDFRAKIVKVEPVPDKEYWTNTRKLWCIVELDGEKYWSWWD